MLEFYDSLTRDFIGSHEYEQMKDQLLAARGQLDGRSGPGSEFTGWLDLPLAMSAEELDSIRLAASRIREEFDVLIAVGIGGSYLGARAVIEALSHHFAPFLSQEKRTGPQIFFAGHQISPDYLRDLIEITKGRKVALNVISKSGRTTEPAIAFRVLREQLLGHLSDQDLAASVFVTTDRDQGALRRLARELGLTAFDIPADVGGRYSVLSPAGLLPIAVAGIDIGALIDGARAESQRSLAPPGDHLAPADRYALDRILLYRKGYCAEILAAYEPSMHYLTEWWKQLFGESEGKDGRGILPLGANFTTDLHSLGQLIQQGPRVLFETVIRFEKPGRDVMIPSEPRDLDELEYLAGTAMSLVNRRAAEGTALAHVAGGVPNMEIVLEERSPYCLGRLIYFFERACALSALMNGVNPFDQPGVETYKRNMFALLGKPGYDPIRSDIQP